MALKSNRNTRGSVNKGTSQNGIPSGLTRNTNTSDTTEISNSVAEAFKMTNRDLLKGIDTLTSIVKQGLNEANQQNTKELKALMPKEPKQKNTSHKLLTNIYKRLQESVSTKDLANNLKKERQMTIYKEFNNKTINSTLSKDDKSRINSILRQRSSPKEMKGIHSYAKENMTNTEKLLENYNRELELLIKQGQETYGMGFQKNADWKTEYKALEVHYGKALSDSIEKERKDKNLLLKGFDSLKGAITDLPKDTQKSLAGGLLGPLNLLISPIQEFFGGSLSKLFGGMKSLFQKFTNKKPTASQVLKEGGQAGLGAIYIGNILTKFLGEDEKKESPFEMLKNKLKDMLGGIFKGLGSGLGGLVKGAGKLLTNPITAIVAGLIWMATDAVRGIFKAKEWGTSKISAGLGGALGGMDKGIKGAFKNMGKWALIGAGIGSFIPVVGTIAGGLIGGAIGMVLGAIGGERLAKGFDKIGVWFKEKVWGGIKTLFSNLWQNIVYVFSAIKEAFLTILNLDGLKKIGEAWKGDGSFAKKLGKSIGAFVWWVVGLPLRVLKAEHKILDKLIVQPFKQLFAKIKEVFSIQNIIKGLSNAKDKLAEIGSNIMEGIHSIFNMENLKNVFNKGVKMVSIVGNFIKDFFSGFAEAIKDALSEIKLVRWVKEKLIDPIFGVFTQIANIFGAIKTMGVKGFTSALASGDFFGSIGDRADALGRAKELSKQKKEGVLSDAESKELSQLMKQWNFKEKDVNDAIIRKDGSIIHTSPDDNIIATKNLPRNVDTIRMDNVKELSKSLEANISSGDSREIVSRLDKIVSLMGQFIEKEPVKFTIPPQNRADLDLIMVGGAL